MSIDELWVWIVSFVLLTEITMNSSDPLPIDRESDLTGF